MMDARRGVYALAPVQGHIGGPLARPIEWSAMEDLKCFAGIDGGSEVHHVPRGFDHLPQVHAQASGQLLTPLGFDHPPTFSTTRLIPSYS